MWCIGTDAKSIRYNTGALRRVDNANIVTVVYCLKCCLFGGDAYVAVAGRNLGDDGRIIGKQGIVQIGKKTLYQFFLMFSRRKLQQGRQCGIARPGGLGIGICNFSFPCREKKTFPTGGKVSPDKNRIIDQDKRVERAGIDSFRLKEIAVWRSDGLCRHRKRHRTSSRNLPDVCG